MKPFFRRGLGLLVILLCTAVWVITTGMGVRQRRARTCQGKGTLEVLVTDSLERTFVAREDIERWLDKEYRAYAGLPLDSVDLHRIEQIVLGHSAVKECQAWLTDDGILHVQLSQRVPVVRFDDGQNGYYADATGFIFPLQARGSVDVPVVGGKLPLNVPRGYKGEAATPQEQAWVRELVALVGRMQGTPWEKNIRRITVDGSGNLTLIPLEGRERFLFGQPVRGAEKLQLMGRYYDSVAPSKEAGYYGTVDVRYRGQLVCRK
ncbi:MAG: hypothetical protein J5669_07855 [Bacteroidales bacterium]|nr:hypothetical protein [Bacteroidales bacterium]